MGSDPRFRLEIVESPYASLVAPFADCMDRCERSHPDQPFLIVIAAALSRHNGDCLLLRQRARKLRQALDQRGNRSVTLVRHQLPL